MTWDELIANCRNATAGYLVPLGEFRMIVPLAVKQREKTERGQLQLALGTDFVVTEAPGQLQVRRKKAAS